MTKLNVDDVSRLTILTLQIRGLFLFPTLFVIVVCMVLGWTGLNGVRNCGTDIGHMIRDHALHSLHKQIDGFMKWPLQWAEMAYEEWERGGLPHEFQVTTARGNYSAVTSLLFHDLSSQIEISSNAATLLYVATSEGLLLLYEWRVQTETMYSWERTIKNEKSLKIYERNRTENTQIKIEREVLGYNPLERKWYQQAAFHEPGQKNWTEIYTSVDGSLAVTVVLKLAHGNKPEDWVGVIAADHTLDTISLFLQSNRPTPGSDLFLFEANGALVASSFSIPIFNTIHGVKERQTIFATPIAPIKAVSDIILERFGSLKQLPETYTTDVTLLGEPFFMDTLTIRDEYGLYWIACLLIPENDVLSVLSKERNRLLGIVVCLLLAVVVISIVVTISTITPMQTLMQILERQEQDISLRSSVLDTKKKR